MLRVYGCVFCSISLLFVYTCKRLIQVQGPLRTGVYLLAAEMEVPYSTWSVFLGVLNGKFVDNFSHASDLTSLQDPFTSRP